jgi:signal transduction histidine kinase/ActR/RegA family two-component response regulator
MRLTHKLLLALALPVVMIWVVGLAAVHVGERSLRQEIETTSAMRAEAVMDEIDRVMHGRIAEWQAYTRSELVQRTLTESNTTFSALPDPRKHVEENDRLWTRHHDATATPFMRQLLDNRLSKDLRLRLAKLHEGHGYALYGEVFFTNRYGANAAQTGITSDYRQDDEPWWQNAMRDGVHVGDVGFDQSAAVYSVDICLRVEDARGEVLGVLKAVLNIREVMELIDVRSAEQASSLLTLYTRDFRIIRRGRIDLPALIEARNEFSALTLDHGKGVTTLERISPANGEPMLSSFAVSRGHGRFDGLGWMVASEAQAATALRPLRTLRLWVGAVASLATALSLAVGGAVGWSLRRRLRKLADATASIGQGQFGAVVAIAGHDEIHELGESFNAMSHKLRQYSESLTRSNDELIASNAHLTTYSQDLERAREQLTEQAQTLQRQSLLLEEARTKAELANDAKSQFLANMSHEIRTPMTAILGFADVLLATTTGHDEREALNIIKSNGEHLLEIINGILDLSKIEAGKLRLETTACSPWQIVADVVSMMRVRAESKGLALSLRFQGPLPLEIHTDPTRVRQALINLVANAIKFTETGEVRLIVELDENHAAGLALRFDVIDTGIGMTTDQLSRLFQPFEQADSSTTRRFGGTGLGLTITKRLVETLGGLIRVASAPASGTTFSIWVPTGPLTNVPLVEAHAEAELPPTVSRESIPHTVSQSPSQSLDQCRVLLAEDGPDNQRLISLILKKAGAEVTLADNGEIAVELALAAVAENRPFDVIVMDMQMPVLDGYNATRQLRRQGYQGTIVGLTAHAMAGDREKCLEAGCDDYASKPIERGELVSLVARYSPSAPAAATV